MARESGDTGSDPSASNKTRSGPTLISWRPVTRDQAKGTADEILTAVHKQIS
jgi:sensor domain CHASE-containing protein